MVGYGLDHGRLSEEEKGKRKGTDEKERKNRLGELEAQNGEEFGRGREACSKKKRTQPTVN